MTAQQESALNLSRVVLFAIVLLVLRITVSALTGSSVGSGESVGHLALRYLLDYWLDAVVVGAVFVWLARVQARLPYLHAFFVLVLHELLGAVVLFAIGGSNTQSPLWLLDWTITVLSFLLGTELGRRWRVIVEEQAEAG